MKNSILIVTPRLSISGGVSSFWNALLPVLDNYDDITIDTFQIGGHGRNVIGSIVDQWNFKKKIQSHIDLTLLNPSLGSRSFFRDALLSKQLVSKNIPFIVFFHGWDLMFEKKVESQYISFFLKTFGKAKKIFVLSKDFKDKILSWGYEGEIFVETTNVDVSLISDFSIENKMKNIEVTKKIKILFLSRLLREKGVFETVDAFLKLSKKFDNIELTIAGDGKDLLELKETVKDSKNIIVTGYVEGQEKIDLFNENHIYCFPTFYGEGLPISILEAMTFGMPVITTNMGGLKEFFQDEKMGYLVEIKNIDAIVDRFELLLADRAKIVKIGQYNYKFAVDNLLSTVVSKRLIAHVKSAINNTKPLND